MRHTAFSALVAIAISISAPLSVSAKELKPETPLAEQMETISKNLKKLGKQIGDGSQRDSSLQLLDKIQNAVKRARTFTPAKAEKIPEAERPQFVADFQKKLDELLVQFEKISGALRDGNTDEAQTLFAGLKQIKRDGHEKFTVEEED